VPAAGLLQLRAGQVQGLGQLPGLVLDPGQGPPGLRLGGLGAVQLGGQVLLLLGQGLDALGEIAATQGAQLGLEALTALLVLPEPALQMVDTGALDLGALGGDSGGMVELVPLPLPGGQGRLGGGDLGARACWASARSGSSWARASASSPRS